MKPEKKIERQIQLWCAKNDVPVWKINSTGFFDTKANRFRKQDQFFKKGVSDLIGIFKGKPLAIEVKSKLGRLTKHQKIFLNEWQKAGGIAIVARSTEDVEKALKHISAGGLYCMISDLET